jgi:bifunctional UDP-N-acetylglucosamine pyrophosphorylase/glucosamine-1-phosphate N-acetyltransferase
MGSDVPKPLLPIAGRPMIEHLFDSVIDSGLDARPIVVVAPDAVEQFRAVLDDRCEYVVQAEQKGTGHAVMMAADAAHGAESIIVLYGDHPFLSAEVIGSLSKLQKSNSAVIAMLTVKVPNFDDDYATFKNWGRIIRDENHEFVAIREAKDASADELLVTELNPAMYAFQADWLWSHLPLLGNKNAAGEIYLTDLIALAVEEGHQVVASSAEPFEVVGVNTPEELKTAERLAG